MNTEQTLAAERLRDFIREYIGGGCKLFSSPECFCLLCDLDRLVAPQEPNPLPKRQTEILALIAKGLQNSEIGLLLHLSTSTVADHLKAMFKTLHVSNRTEAAILGKSKGWI